MNLLHYMFLQQIANQPHITHQVHKVNFSGDGISGFWTLIILAVFCIGLIGFHILFRNEE